MLGVKYCGVWRDHSGYGQANRNFICSLVTAGVDVTTELVTQVNERGAFGWTGELANHLKDRNIPYRVKFLHITPDLYPKYMEEGKYHIGKLFWETNKLPKEWVGPCNLMNEIWTASDQQADMIRKSGVTVPVHAFPQPLDITNVNKFEYPFKIPNFTGYTFYSIFQWIERKNPRALVETFLKTFSGKTDVALLLKTYRVNYSESEFNMIKEDIKHWKQGLNLGHYPKIFLVEKLLRTSDMFRLHTTGDCFVTTTRGEGWQIPAAEAMMSAKPVVGIDRTGLADYMNPDIYYACKTDLVQTTEVHWIPWYTADMLWLEIDQADLAQKMLDVYNNRDKAKAVGKRSQQFVTENFSYNAVGEKMKVRLEEIYKFL